MLTEALVVASPGASFEYKKIELAADDLRPNEVMLRIKATGVNIDRGGACHTDYNFSREPTMPDLYPGVLGHEGAGIVERIGSAVTKVAKGDHVVAVYTSCGECKYCKRKETSYCDLWFQYNFGVGRLDGSKAFSYRPGRRGSEDRKPFFGQSSFAKHVLVMETGLVKIDKGLPFELAAPLGCGVMTGAGAMLNVIQPTHDMAVAVVGAGAVGLSAIMALKMLDKPPRKIIAVDIVGSRLVMARKFGATHGVNSTNRPNLMDVLMDITDGRGVDGSIDTTGRPAVIKGLINSTARKGKVVTVGVGDLSAEAGLNMFEMVQAGCSYVGCNQGNCYPQEFLPKLLEANEAGLFPYHELSKTYQAKDMEKAVKDILSGATIKAVLLWD